jgi:predicted DsbA family dithiol-disulfide isomerase
MIDVEVWADVRCPWCWIGLRRLREALRRVPEGVSTRHRSYLLEPDGPRTPGRPMAEIAVAEWGMPAEQWRSRSALIRAEGRREGLEVNVDTALTFDSRMAHRLLKLADARGLSADASWDAVFDAHFRLNRDLADETVIREVADSMGLANTDVESLLGGAEFAEEVLADHREAQQRGIRSTPTVVIGERVLAGSRSANEIAEFIVRAEAAR